MFQKIVSFKQCTTLPINTFFNQISIGEPEDIFLDENIKNIDKRKLSLNNLEFEEMELVSTESIINNKLLSGLDKLLYSSIKVINQSLIKESKYWIKNEKISAY